MASILHDAQTDTTPAAAPAYHVAARSNWKDRAPVAWHRRIISSVRALLAEPREAVDARTMPALTSAWTCPPVDPADFSETVERLADNPSSVPGAVRVEARDTVAPSPDYRGLCSVVNDVTDQGIGYASSDFLELVKRDAIQPESVTMDDAGNFVGMTREEWEAAAVCPAWCDGDHNTADAESVRQHFGRCTSLRLSADFGQSCDGYEPDVCTSLVTHTHRYEPVVQMDTDTNRNYVEMTLDEAEELARNLLDMVKAGRSTARAACDHHFPLIMTGSSARPGNCSKCGSPRYVQSGPNMFDGEN